MVHSEPQRTVKASACGQARQKKEMTGKIRKRRRFSIEAGYDLEVSPREYPAFVVRREIVSRY
jgi:hypothetical protein